MRSFEGKVVVVTGAASGIGFALAQRWSEEGMSVVIADWDEPALEAAAERLGAGGADVLAVTTDVSDEASVRRLADATYDRFGAAHVVCNNAAILGPNLDPVWEIPQPDWERVFAVNFFGVLNGLRVFVPRMLEQDADCHVVNTASMGALTTNPRICPYIASKHAIMAVSESLQLQLRARGARIGVSVLCPGPTRTFIVENELKKSGAPPAPSPPPTEAPAEGAPLLMNPADTAAVLVDAVRAGRLYVFPNPGSRERIQGRYDAIMTGFADTLD
jgi:NAD(P)-dependent dehydrogenase (short-subunit alcohol dehydrogenase family)